MYAVLIVIVLIAITLSTSAIWICKPRAEAMTRIRRGVGVLNTADETPVAAGIIHSTPIMDLTHTYWNGVENTSCDECPNAESCPRCPQYARERFDNTDQDVYTNVDDDVLPEYHDGAPSVSRGEVHNTDPDIHPRELMGAGSGRRGKPRSALRDFAPDDTQEDQLIMLGRSCKRNLSPAVKLLYNNTLNLDTTAHPSAPDCEFTNEIGYSYKEPC